MGKDKLKDSMTLVSSINGWKSIDCDFAKDNQTAEIVVNAIDIESIELTKKEMKQLGKWLIFHSR